MHVRVCLCVRASVCACAFAILARPYQALFGATTLGYRASMSDRMHTQFPSDCSVIRRVPGHQSLWSELGNSPCQTWGFEPDCPGSVKLQHTQVHVARAPRRWFSFWFSINTIKGGALQKKAHPALLYCGILIWTFSVVGFVDSAHGRCIFCCCSAWQLFAP